MKFMKSFRGYRHEDGTDHLTVDAWDVMAFYDRHGESYDDVIHFDGVSVVESDADMYLHKKNLARIAEIVGRLHPRGIRDVIYRWIAAVELEPEVVVKDGETRVRCNRCGALFDPRSIGMTEDERKAYLAGSCLINCGICAE